MQDEIDSALSVESGSSSLQKAFPRMYENEDGKVNEHPELTALKPPDAHKDLKAHPSSSFNINGDYNYFTYGWMREAEESPAKNWQLLGALCAIIAVCALLLICTKLVKFVQFFIAKKQYKRINVTIKP